MRRNLTRREWLTAAGSASLLGFAGMAQADSHTTISGAPVVESADRPTIGTDSSNPTATVYGNFKCPITRGFVLENFQVIIEEFVESGQLNIEFANLAYNPGSTSSTYISSSDPRLAAFGRAVWNDQPGNYWSFFEQMFTNPVSGYLTYDDIAEEASARGVSNASAVANTASQYESAPNNVSSAASSDGVSWIPTMELAGDTAAPHHGTQSILNWIDARVDEAPSGTTEEEQTSDAEDTADEEAEPDQQDTSDEQDQSDSNEESTDDSGSESSDGSDSESSEDADESAEDTSSEDTSSEDTSSEDTSSEDTSSEDTSSEDTSSEDTSSEDTSGDDSESGSGGSSGDSASEPEEESDDDDDDSEPEPTSDTETGGSCVIGEGIL